jgi:CPA2 family monovalent cation:H+ antiporter-2
MNHDIPILNDLLVVILFSLPVLFLFGRIGLSPVTGFISAGILIGPHGLGLVSSIGSVEIAAEIGAVLLLFVVGLELSLSGMAMTPWRIYLTAVLQVLVTTAVGFTAGTLLGFGSGAAVVIGFALAVSSSAIVLKGLVDKGEIQTPLGRGVVTICVVQDFAIVPMMLIVTTPRPRGVWISPLSTSPFSTIAEEETARAKPMTTAAPLPNPSSVPAVNPTAVVTSTCNTAVR